MLESLRPSLSLCSFLVAGLVYWTSGCGGTGGPHATNAGRGGSGGSGSGSGGKGGSGSGGKGGSGNNGGEGGGEGGTGGGGGGSNGGTGGGGGGSGGGGTVAPPASCNAAPSDSPADTLDFTNNQIASPAPPGNLSPANAPQIIVFGWDDVESLEGVTFVNTLMGSIKNPNGSKAGTTLNPNACYLGSPAYLCGNGSLHSNPGPVTMGGFDIGNHTIDHLESNSTWQGIPQKYKDTQTGSWRFTDDGYGPGIAMDQATWEMVLGVNQTALFNILSINKLGGFRAPRLELNDAGLNALKKMGYYDQDLEETMAEGHVEAATQADTAAKKGFNWIPWPYTLDHGSPGTWQQQWDGDKKYLVNFPTGVWEIPVYQLYVPAKSGLGKTIADTMIKSDMSCTFPEGTPADQRKHCFLSDGEVNPGDVIKEITGFDFNTFIYSRLTKEQFLTIMKHSFMVRFYGNRAPLTYGMHPIEYTAPYDDFTLGTQANNYGYRDVLTYSKYSDRKAAMQEFVAWVRNDPVFSKETYFLSGQQLVDFMKAPYDKAGMKVAPDTVATPASNGIFTRLKWVPDHATLTTVDGNSADISFDVTDAEGPPVGLSAGVTQGSLKNVTHIDIKYSTDVPFRIRFLTSDGETQSTVALLAGTGTTDRVARIRVKDFFVGPEAPAAKAAATALVNADYMSKVTGIAIESGHTSITGAKKFTTHIRQITLHGVATSALCQ